MLYQLGDIKLLNELRHFKAILNGNKNSSRVEF